jgi:hypothetical protein
VDLPLLRLHPNLGARAMSLDEKIRLITTKIMRERSGSERMSLQEWEAFLRELLK